MGDVGRHAGGVPWPLILATVEARDDLAEQRVRVAASDSPSAPATMKNWPPVFGLPVFAIATLPGGYWYAGVDGLRGSSSGIV